MGNQLDKIINLVRRTGDRLVVLDRNDSNKSYVVMDIDAYEQLLDGNFINNNKGEDDYDDDYEENYQEDKDKEDEFWRANDEFSDLPEESEFNYSERSLSDIGSVADEYKQEGEDNNDFVPIGDVFNSAEEKQVSAGEVDNNWGYGTIEQNIKNHQADHGQRRSKWEIAPEIRGKTPVEMNAETEEDRYYLETI
ncbi:MAG: hypothetical protein AAB956_04165 [Patescibacteria group bacterium]